MAKPKPVNFKLIPEYDPDTGEQSEPYRLLGEIRKRHHLHLQEAKIALAWRYGWTPDKDGRLTLGRCRKASDLDRELAAYDFVILLNKEVWDEGLREPQKRALIDHELMHAQVCFDDKGNWKTDARGRIVYRTRGHDVEEFRDIVMRHGVYKEDIAAFALAIRAHTKAPLYVPAPQQPAGPDGSNTEIAEPKLPEPPPVAVDLTSLPWWKWPVTELGLPGPLTCAIQFAGLTTLGALNMYLVNDQQLRGVHGIDPHQAEKVRDALDEIRRKASEPKQKENGDA